MQKTFSLLGIHVQLNQQITMRFPLYLNLVTAVFALWVATRMREPLQHVKHAEGPSNPLRLIVVGGRWILAHPLVMLIIVAGFLNDSVIRLFMTFATVYYRLIHMPAILFGVLGAAMGAFGFFVSPIARRLVEKKTYIFNFKLLALLTFAGLAGVALHLRYAGVLFVIPLLFAMSFLNFFISYYINSMVESGQRATILSFKGVAFNLGYGMVGLLFAGLLRLIKSSDHVAASEAVFSRALPWIPVYFLFTIVLLVVAGRRVLKRVAARGPRQTGAAGA